MYDGKRSAWGTVAALVLSLVVLAAVALARPPRDAEPPKRCADGIDNDDDGFIDHPADPECESPSDNNEARDDDDDDDGPTPTPSATTTATATASASATATATTGATVTPSATAGPSPAATPKSTPTTTPTAAPTQTTKGTGVPVPPATATPTDAASTPTSDARGTAFSSSGDLYEDAVPVVRLRGRLTRRGAHITLLSVTASMGSTTTIRCRGRSCPRKRLKRTMWSSTVRFRALERRFAAGTTLEVRVVQSAAVGKLTRFVIRRGQPPRRIDHCLSPGSLRRQPC